LLVSLGPLLEALEPAATTVSLTVVVTFSAASTLLTFGSGSLEGLGSSAKLVSETVTSGVSHTENLPDFGRES